MKAHGLYGHPCEKRTRAIAKALSQELTKRMTKKCLDCVKGKAEQKNLTKATKDEEDKKDEGRVYLDLSKVLVPPKLKFKSRNPNWLIVVDEKTGLKTRRFFTSKNGMVEPTCEMFQM